MNKNEIKNRIEEVEKELAQLRQDLEKEDKGVWKPVNKECYYYIDTTGGIIATYNSCSISNVCRFLFGNYYKTKEEAEYQAKVQKYTNLFRKYVEEHSDKLDWKDNNKKWYVFYDTKFESVGYDFYFYHIVQGTIYASSEQILKDAVEFVGEDNVIKYVLGVK